MKHFVLFLFLLTAFSLCQAELTLPKIEKPVAQPQEQKRKKEPNKTAEQKDPNKLLNIAASKMHLRGIYNALLAGADINALYEGTSALHEAILANSPGTVKYLIKCGANVNLKDESEFVPILTAVQVKNLEIIDILLENGADINAKVENGGSYQIGEDKNPIYKFIYDQDAIVEAEDLTTIKHLISKGFKANGKNLSAALHKSTIFNDMSAIKYITNKGRKYKNFDMTPALVVTIEEGYLDAMKYLRANGAAIPNIKLITPNKEIYDYLKLHNADIAFDPKKENIIFTETHSKNKKPNKSLPAKKPGV